MRNWIVPTALGVLAVMPVRALDPEADPSTETPVEQVEFEAFMRCYGHMAGSLDLLKRIEGKAGDEAAIVQIRRQGVTLMNDLFAETHERLEDPVYGLNLFEGYMARQAGRARFDAVDTLEPALQYEHFRTHAGLTQPCLDVATRLSELTDSEDAGSEETDSETEGEAPSGASESEEE